MAPFAACSVGPDEGPRRSRASWSRTRLPGDGATALQPHHIPPAPVDGHTHPSIDADGTEAVFAVQRKACGVLGEDSRQDRPDTGGFSGVDERGEQFAAHSPASRVRGDVDGMLDDATVCAAGAVRRHRDPPKSAGTFDSDEAVRSHMPGVEGVPIGRCFGEGRVGGVDAGLIDVEYLGGVVDRHGADVHWAASLLSYQDVILPQVCFVDVSGELMAGFAEAVEAFFVSRAPRKDSPHTVAAYRRDLSGVAAHVATALGTAVADIDCADLSVPVMRSAFAGFAASRAKSSIARAWSVWNAFFSFMVGEAMMEGNPMSGVARPKTSVKSPKPLRSEDAPEQLLSAVAAGARQARHPWPQRDLAVLALVLLTGVRSSELLGLTVGDVAGPVGERRLVIRSGKGDADRVVPVEASLEALLDEYVASRRARFPQTRWPLPREAVLFVDHRGQALTRNQLQYLVRQCYRFAGVDDQVERGALVHALRHTFATRLGQSGASAVEVMELLGHRSLSATQGYIKATARELREAARSNPVYRSLDRVVGEGSGGQAPGQDGHGVGGAGDEG